MSTITLITAIVVWGAIHSILASLQVKAALLKMAGPGVMRFYRLAYNIFAVISFLPIAWLMLVLPDQPLYSVPAPWKYIFWAGQAAAAVLLLIGVLQTDAFFFAGLRQPFEPVTEDTADSRLVKSGLYRLIRHPLYTAGLLFMWLATSVSANTFIVFIGLTAYILVGAWFEERKLVREFGEEYMEYRRNTPMLIPGLRLKR